MRQYRIDDDVYDEEESSARVVPIRGGSRPRAVTAFPSRSEHEPWTRRDSLPPPSPRRSRRALPESGSGRNRTHRLMIASFVIICVGMVIGMLLVRIWDEASRTVAALPAESNGTLTVPPPAPAPSTEPAQPETPPAPPGQGAITTEIRVIQPNYTVAPGDTLGSIARRQGTTVDALASINNLENRNSLSVGQKLIIP